MSQKYKNSFIYEIKLIFTELYVLRMCVICKGAPKGRDGRDSSLPILKLVGIGRDDMVVILKNPK